MIFHSTKLFLAGLILAAAALFSASAQAQEYHPDDVKAIDLILKNNDAEGKLAAAGWKPGQPDTWPVLEEITSTSDVGLTPKAGVIWYQSRIVGLQIPRQGLAGEMDLTGMEGLFRLSVRSNRLTSLKGLQSLRFLQMLVAEDNQLTDVGDLSRIAGLGYINVSGNKLRNVGDLGNLAEMQVIKIADNPVNDLGDLKKLTEMTIFDATNVPLNKALNFEQNSNLTHLRLNLSEMKDIGFLKHLPRSLRVLMLEGFSQPIFSLENSYLPFLETLTLGAGQQLQTVNLDERRLLNVTFNSHITAEQIEKPGYIGKLTLPAGGSYLMGELVALHKKLQYADTYSIGRQLAVLGDAAKNLKAGQGYKLADLSPNLSEDFRRSGPAASLAVYLTESLENGQPAANPAAVLTNGSIVFPKPGRYSLVNSISIFGPEPVEVQYKDVFEVGAE